MSAGLEFLGGGANFEGNTDGDLDGGEDTEEVEKDRSERGEGDAAMIGCLADGEEGVKFGEADIDEGRDGGLSGGGVRFCSGGGDRVFELADGGGRRAWREGLAAKKFSSSLTAAWAERVMRARAALVSVGTGE